MKIELRDDVIHKKNNEYPCVVVQWQPEDYNFFSGAMNWMPTNKEVVALVVMMKNNDPKNEFKDMILKQEIREWLE